MEKKNKGITLIALVVTIVVLLILAGISISMLTGENGVITQARKSKEETRGGTVEEQRDLWRSNNKLDKQTGDNTTQTLNELLADLIEKNELTEVERDKILDEGFVIIGSHYIDFTLSDEDDEIDWSKLGPGLYKTGTKELIKSWQQLIDDGDIIVTDNKLNFVTADAKGDLIISNEITEIRHHFISDFCFYSNENELTGVFIPKSVISADGFAGGKNIQKIVIEEGVQNIPAEAFRGCSSLKSVILPNTITNIERCAFYKCTKLESIIIPDSVTIIGFGAFMDCTSLKNINIPKNVINIGERAFNSCFDLKSITVSKENSKYDSRNNCNAIIETDSNTLIHGCSTTVIPDSVIGIRDEAFYYCLNLTNIVIPDGVIGIGESAFWGCSSLECISIPKSMTSILGYAFRYCDKLSTVNYEGTNEDWNNITIRHDNTALTSAKINYNYNKE